MINKIKDKKIINTIQKKIIFATLLMQIIVSSFAGLFLYKNSRNILIENAKQETINLLHPINTSTVEKLKSIPNKKDKQKYLNIMFDFQGPLLFESLKERMPNIKDFYIYTNKDDIHTIYNEQLWVFPALKKSLSQKTTTVTFGKESVYVNFPIHVDNDSIGGVIIEYAKTKIAKEKTKALIVAITMALITFFISLILIKIFVSLTTDYLQKIISDLEKISKGKNIADTNYNYPALLQTELEPLVTSYLNMKKTIADQINKLTTEINKRKKAETECTLNRSSLAEIVEEKNEIIKETNLQLKDEIERKKILETKLKKCESILESLLKNKHYDGILILSNKGEVITANHQFSIGWELPKDVVNNDTEEQLIKYFSYQIINNKKFNEQYKKCSDKELELGEFELKNGKNVLITYQPLEQELKLIGKIFTFHFAQ